MASSNHRLINNGRPDELLEVLFSRFFQLKAMFVESQASSILIVCETKIEKRTAEVLKAYPKPTEECLNIQGGCIRIHEFSVFAGAT